MNQRNIQHVLLVFIVLLFCVACSSSGRQQHPTNQHVNNEPISEETTFMATIKEVEYGLMVSPLEDELEARSSDLIMVSTKDAKILDRSGNTIRFSELEVGMTVEIVYDGIIMESYPAQIRSFQVQIIEKE